MDKITVSNEGKVGRLQQIRKQEAGRDIANRDIIHYHNHREKKEQLKLPVEGPSNLGLEAATKYWEFIIDGKKRFSCGFLLPFLASAFIVQDFWYTEILHNIYPTFLGMLVIMLQLSAIILKFNSSCPKCKKGFAMSEVERILINKDTYKNKTVNNIKVTEECRYCGYKHSHTDVETEDIRKTRKELL